jgi:hypothetical protein
MGQDRRTLYFPCLDSSGLEGVFFISANYYSKASQAHIYQGFQEIDASVLSHGEAVMIRACYCSEGMHESRKKF